MKKTIIWIGAIAILLAVGLIGYGFISRGASARAAQNDPQTAPVERGDMTAQVGATGTVRAKQSAELAWQTAGSVESIPVAEGDQVASGAELATLAKTSLSQNIILARADLVNAQKALDDLLHSQTSAAQARQAVETAQQALDDLGKNTELQRAQAWDALIQARQAYTDTVDARANLVNLPNSPKAQDARHELENAQALVRQLQASLSGMPDTNPEKPKLLFELKMARIRAARAKAVSDQYGGEASADELEQADANTALAAAKLADAQVAWERLKDGPAPEDRALLEAKLADAQRAYDQVKDGPNTEDVAAAQARRDAAQAALDTARLEAPFAGTVTLVENQPGDQVNPGTPAFRIDDLSRLLVDVPISEVDINQVQQGQPVVLTFDSILGKEYHGKVTSVDRVGQDQQGVVNFVVTVELTDADEQVRPGMTAAVNITVSQLKDVLLVPNRAVRTVDGKRVVYVQRDGSPVMVPIRLGRSSDTNSQVLDGDLKEGDPILLNPPTSLSDLRPGGGGAGTSSPFGGSR